MVFKYLRTLGVSIALLTSLGANAANNNIQCSGTIVTLGLHSPNGVFLKLSGMNNLVEVCDLGATLGTTNPIPAEQCKAIYSLLLAAQASAKPINVVFDNVVNGSSCSSFVSWEVATARWVTFQ